MDEFQFRYVRQTSTDVLVDDMGIPLRLPKDVCSFKEGLCNLQQGDIISVSVPDGLASELGLV